MSPFFIALALTNLVVLFMLVRLPVRAYWLVKVGIILGLAAVTFAAWGATDSGKGWPVVQAFPTDAQFLACDVIEPNPAAGEPGRIYVWMIPLDNNGTVLSYRSKVGEPRAYSVPYDRSLHQACETAKKGSAQGLRMGIGHGHGRPGPHAPFVPYVLPSVHLPRKVTG